MKQTDAQADLIDIPGGVAGGSWGGGAEGGGGGGGGGGTEGVPVW